MKLKDAIQWFEDDISNDRTLEQSTDNNITIILEAAKDLQTLIEAREKATAGEWAECLYSDQIVHKEAPNSNIFAFDDAMYGDIDFILLAANLTWKDTER